MRFPLLPLLLFSSCTPRSSPSPAVDAGATALSASVQPLPEAVPAPPTLPLAQQVELKTREARDTFPAVRIRVLRDAFVLAVVGSDALLERAAAFVERTLTAYYNGRFQDPPAYAVLLYFFQRFDEYDQYVGTHFHVPGSKYYGLFGKYSHVAAVDGSHVDAYLPTLAHELVHPILDGELGIKRPEWASECVGSLFEAPTFPAPGEIRGAPNWRFRQVLHPALHPADGGAPAEVSLPALFQMDDATFLDEHAQDLNYAVARSFCLYMDTKGKLWPWIAAWRGHVTEDPTGEAAFTAVTGETPAQADAAWRKWVDRL